MDVIAECRHVVLCDDAQVLHGRIAAEWQRGRVTHEPDRARSRVRDQRFRPVRADSRRAEVGGLLRLRSRRPKRRSEPPEETRARVRIGIGRRRTASQGDEIGIATPDELDFVRDRLVEVVTGARPPVATRPVHDQVTVPALRRIDQPERDSAQPEARAVAVGRLVDAIRVDRPVDILEADRAVPGAAQLARHLVVAHAMLVLRKRMRRPGESARVARRNSPVVEQHGGHATLHFIRLSEGIHRAGVQARRHDRARTRGQVAA